MRPDYTLHCTPRPPSLDAAPSVDLPEPSMTPLQAAIAVPFWTVVLSTVTGLAWPAAALIVGLLTLLAMRPRERHHHDALAAR